MAEIQVKYRKRNHTNKKTVLFVRQFSILIGGLIILAALTLKITGFLKPVGVEDYTATYTKTNPAMVDPALLALAALPPSASAENPNTVNNTEKDNTSPETTETAALNGTNSTLSNEQAADVALAESKPEKDTAIATTSLPATVQTTLEAVEEATGTEPVSTDTTENGVSSDPSLAAVILPDEPLPISENWLEAKIQLHKDDINSQDLDDFRRIIQNLDQSYIGNLSKAGYDSENQQLLKTHLLERLSSADYEKCKELFFTYSYLLSDN